MKNAEFFTDNPNVIVCKKNQFYTVKEQNIACKKLCGNKLGMKCTTDCMLYTESLSHKKGWDNGIKVFENKLIHDEYFDIVYIIEKKSFTSLLIPLKKKHQKIIRYFKRYPLSNREAEVLNLKVKGHTNHEICERLFISLGTLKTHINHIYKKVPKEEVFWN